MYQPNNQDNPTMDNEWTIGTSVTWAEHETDEFDRPTSTQMLTLVGIGNSQESYDYIVEAKSGNRFYVRHWEIVVTCK